MADGKGEEPDETGDGDVPRPATLDLDSASPDEPVAEEGWDPQLVAAAGTAAAGVAALIGALALAVAANAAAQQPCVFPDDVYSGDGWPRSAAIVACLSVAAAALGVAGLQTGRRVRAAMQISVSLAALLLAGAALALAMGDAVTRPHFDLEPSNSIGVSERYNEFGMPLVECR